MKPGLSIVIPTYNMARWLPVALESCLWQSEPDIEVVVVNDGSTDNSLEIAEVYAKTDPRVRVISKANAGLGPARQSGQDAATGEFVTWLDADDFLDVHAARDLLATARKDKVNMVCGNAVVFSDRTFNSRRYFHRPAASGLTFDDPAYWKCKVVWRWIFNLDFVRANALPHPSYKFGQDVCFMYAALCRVGRFSQCASQFYYFRQEHKSAGRSLEVEIEHDLPHFRDVKDTLLAAGRVKPLIKYLTENYFRNIKKLTPQLVGGEAWRLERCLDISLDIFRGLDPEWFEPKFLAPELKGDADLLVLARALIAGDSAGALGEFDKWRDRGAGRKGVKKTSPLHTVRRRVKSWFNPLSHKSRSRARRLEALARKRLGSMWRD